MSYNISRRLYGPTAPTPTHLATVIASDADGVTVQRPDGAITRVRGEAEVGQVVYYRDGAIEAIAGEMQVVEQEG